MKIQRSVHLSVEQPDYGIEMEMKQKEEQGITESQGGVKPAPGKRDGLKQTRRSSQPAQQELPLLIYINPTDISILPAPSRMLNLNLTPLRIYISQTGQWTYGHEAHEASNERLKCHFQPEERFQIQKLLKVANILYVCLKTN